MFVWSWRSYYWCGDLGSMTWYFYLLLSQRPWCHRESTFYIITCHWVKHWHTWITNIPCLFYFWVSNIINLISLEVYWWRIMKLLWSNISLLMHNKTRHLLWEVTICDDNRRFMAKNDSWGSKNLRVDDRFYIMYISKNSEQCVYLNLFGSYA